MSPRANAFLRLYHGETSFDFAGRWRRWFIISGAVILIGLISVGVRGLNFSVDFKGGTIWEVPSTATVSEARAAVNRADPGLGQSAVIAILTDRSDGKRTIEVQASPKDTASGNNDVVTEVRGQLAALAHTNPNNVVVNSVGASWGSDISHKAVKAVIIFLIAVSIYIWLRFEGKMAVAALVALLHDILVTVGIYSLSGFQVSPDTVIAFLTILGYSLYDTIVVFDKVQENTRSVASSAKFTYTDYVNLSMNQVLARSLNTSFVAIIPILSIEVIGAWILGATTLNDFGLALLIGLTTGAYSSIFIASPLLALLKEREPRYADIRRRMAPGPSRRLTPAAAAAGRAPVDTGGGAGSPSRRSRIRSAAPNPVRRPVRSRPDGTEDATPPSTRARGVIPGPSGSGPTEAPRRRAGGSRAVDADATNAPPTGSAPTDPAPTGPTTIGPAPTDPATTDHATTDPAGTDPGATGGRDPSPPARGTPIPPRSGNRPPPRPRKRRRR
jgi:preprotein translocase subunit SecF